MLNKTMTGVNEWLIIMIVGGLARRISYAEWRFYYCMATWYPIK